jgi:hypothetical protein
MRPIELALGSSAMALLVFFFFLFGRNASASVNYSKKRQDGRKIDGSLQVE